VWASLEETKRRAWNAWGGGESKGKGSFVKLNHTRMRVGAINDYNEEPPVALIETTLTTLAAIVVEDEDEIRVSWETKGDVDSNDWVEIAVSGPYTSEGRAGGLKWRTEKVVMGDKTETNLENMTREGKYWIRARYVKEDGQTSTWMEVRCQTWSPMSIGDCFGWYRADRGITKGEGEKVKKWADQSGWGRDLLQPVPGYQPERIEGAINGKTAIAFNGVDEYMKTEAGERVPQPITMIIVLEDKENVVTEYNIWIDGLEQQKRFSFRYIKRDTNEYGLNCGAELAWVTSQKKEWGAWILVGRGGTSKIYWNGTMINTGNAGTQGLNGLVTGANYTRYDYGKGKIAEVILYSKELNAAEMELVGWYIESRYGIKQGGFLMMETEEGTEIGEIVGDVGLDEGLAGGVGIH